MIEEIISVIKYFIYSMVVISTIYWIFSTSSKEKSDAVKKQVKNAKDMFANIDEDRIRDLYKEKERNRRKQEDKSETKK